MRRCADRLVVCAVGGAYRPAAGGARVQGIGAKALRVVSRVGGDDVPTMSQLEVTAERILRSALATAVAGDRAVGMDEDARALALAHLDECIAGSMGMLRECLEQASLEGANTVHRALHAQPGVDPFMLDEAVEHAPEDDDG